MSFWMELFGSRLRGSGLPRAPCIRAEHLSEAEQRVLRLAVNRLGEKGEWNLDELKIEFEDLVLIDAPIEISGFTTDEIDHIVLDEADDAIEGGAPLAGSWRNRGRPLGRCFCAWTPPHRLWQRDRP